MANGYGLKLPKLQYRTPTDPNAQHALATLAPIIQAARDEGQRPTKYGSVARGVAKAVEVYQQAAERSQKRWDAAKEASDKRVAEWEKEKRAVSARAYTDWYNRKVNFGGSTSGGGTGGGAGSKSKSLTPFGRAQEGAKEIQAKMGKGELSYERPTFHLVEDTTAGDYWQPSVPMNVRTEDAATRNAREQLRTAGAPWAGIERLKDGRNEHSTFEGAIAVGGKDLLPTKVMGADGKMRTFHPRLRLVRKNAKGNFTRNPDGAIRPNRVGGSPTDNYTYLLVDNFHEWGPRSKQSSYKVSGNVTLPFTETLAPIDVAASVKASREQNKEVVILLSDEEIAKRNKEKDYLDPNSQRFKDEEKRQGLAYEKFRANLASASGAGGRKSGSRYLIDKEPDDVVQMWVDANPRPQEWDASTPVTRLDALGGLRGLARSTGEVLVAPLRGAVNVLRGAGGGGQQAQRRTAGRAQPAAEATIEKKFGVPASTIVGVQESRSFPDEVVFTYRNEAGEIGRDRMKIAEMTEADLALLPPEVRAQYEALVGSGGLSAPGLMQRGARLPSLRRRGGPPSPR